jgi:hypothetical protein
LVGFCRVGLGGNRCLRPEGGLGVLALVAALGAAGESVWIMVVLWVAAFSVEQVVWVEMCWVEVVVWIAAFSVE